MSKPELPTRDAVIADAKSTGLVYPEGQDGIETLSGWLSDVPENAHQTSHTLGRSLLALECAYEGHEECYDEVYGGPIPSQEKLQREVDELAEEISSVRA